MKEIDVEKYFKPSLKDARRRSRKETEYEKFQLSEYHLKIGNNKKYFIRTYGCQGNEADSEIMSGILEKMGYTKANSFEDSDLIILNTCAIRENAENKVWGQIGHLKELKNKNPNLLLGVAGCMPQEEVVVEKLLKTYKHVDIVLGTHNIHKLPSYIESAMYSKERVIEVYSKEGSVVENLPMVRNHKHKAWVNIMYGCDEFCTYCIVPYTRGRERSRNKNEIIKEVIDLYNKGYREVTLLGQNVNAYGKDFKDNSYTFGNLLYDLDKTGIERIRFMTSHPHDLDKLTMEAMRDNMSVMAHFHLPIQSGSNKTLKRMNRRYTKESILEVIKQLREYVPNISITTDIIVGFPGETKKDFSETMDIVEKAQFDGAYTYLFSPREGTPAYNFKDEVAIEDKKTNLYKLNELVNDLAYKSNSKYLNKTVKVLVEGISKNNDSVLSGYSETSKLINFEGDRKLIGEIVEVKVTDYKTWYLVGELL